MLLPLYFLLIQKQKETMLHIHCMNFITHQQPLEIYTVLNSWY